MNKTHRKLTSNSNISLNFDRKDSLGDSADNDSSLNILSRRSSFHIPKKRIFSRSLNNLILQALKERKKLLFQDLYQICIKSYSEDKNFSKSFAEVRKFSLGTQKSFDDEFKRLEFV